MLRYCMCNIGTRFVQVPRLFTGIGKPAVTDCTLLPGHGISVRTLSTTILFVLVNPTLCEWEVPLHFSNFAVFNCCPSSVLRSLCLPFYALFLLVFCPRSLSQKRDIISRTSQRNKRWIKGFDILSFCLVNIHL